MLSLVKKDFLCMLPIMKKQLCISCVLFIILSLSMKNAAFLSAMLIMTIIIYATSSFSYDEYAHFDAYALTLPIERKDIVKAKYVFFLGSILIGGCIAALCSLGLNVFLKNAVSEIMASLFGSILIFTPMALFTLLLMLKFGAEKGRNYMTIGYLIPLIAIMLGAPLLAKSGIAMPNSTVIVIILLAVLALELAAILLSYKIALKLYSKREF